MLNLRAQAVQMITASRSAPALLAYFPDASTHRPPQVGAVNATFGIKGVQEHCFFLKTMEDAKALRRHIR